jgi:uncharacterized protein YbjT (DUF2867 family)
MILVSGGTGFIGQALIRHLVTTGEQVRILLKPGLRSPNLPHGIPLEVAVCSYNDERGLRAVMKGVDTVFHLVSAERSGIRAELEVVDIELTRVIASVAAQAGIRRLFYISHLGSERSSAYPLLRAKGIAESLVINSGVGYTIFRSAPVFGPNDRFTTALAKLIRKAPWVFLMPGQGETLIQPIWIEDLIACLTWAIRDENLANQVISVGGPEALPFRQIIEMIMEASKLHRNIISFQPSILRLLSIWVEQSDERFPVSSFWLDYLAANRICPLDTLPTRFGLIPARISQHLDHLRN